MEQRGGPVNISREALHNCPLASLLQKKSNPSVQEARVSLDFFARLASEQFYSTS
jgi:hypothetical protein